MLNDYTVNIVYKNRTLEPVTQKAYSLTDYCQEQKLHLMHIIADVENAFYNMQDNKSKEDWDAKVMVDFQHIRHKLLDTANSIERLPKNLFYKGQNVDAVNSADYVADIINKATANKQ